MSVNNLQGSDFPKKQPVSARKAEANRRNAARSTGPKTVRGKANSRKNAIKHGLFICAIDETFHNENPKEFYDFCNDLWREKLPIGPSEECEVEFIAMCWLRLARLWRYENAAIESAEQSVSDAVEMRFNNPYLDHPERVKLMSLLQSAKSEIEKNGKICAELLEKLSIADVFIGAFWSEHETRAETLAKKNIDKIAKSIAEAKKISLSEAKILLAENPKSQPEYARSVALLTIESFIDHYARRWSRDSLHKVDLNYRLRAIPDDGTVEKIIRYGNAIERQMNHALARLERLQLRRKGEAVPPPMSLHMIR